MVAAWEERGQVGSPGLLPNMRASLSKDAKRLAHGGLPLTTSAFTKNSELLDFPYHTILQKAFRSEREPGSCPRAYGL